LNFLRPDEERRILEVSKPNLDDLVIRLPLRTGVSPGEMAQLTVYDVNYEYNLLYVWRSKVSRDHLVIVDSDTIWRIYKYADDRRSGMLLTLQEDPKMRVQHIRRIVKKWARNAGLERWKRVTPYTLRHTFCIRWIMARGTLESLRRQLGHRSLQRLQHYLDFDYTYVREEYSRIFPDDVQVGLIELIH